MIDLTLPLGSLLLHIGPHKTGTTAIQASLHDARDALVRQRVRLAGSGRHPVSAVVSVTGKPGMIGEAPPDQARWRALVRQMRRPGPARRVLSSEFLADCDADQAGGVVSDLGPDTHVVATLRPLHAILPSQWQQYVQNGLRTSYDRWLELMLDRPPGSPPTTSFWRRHRHDELIARWAGILGPERTTVVVLDPTDRSMLLRSFERLLALDDGTLQPSGEALANRSLTWGEAETLRAMNRMYKAGGMPPQTYSRLIRHAAILHMKADRPPGPTEARITTPQWAAQRATALSAEYAEVIAGLGVRVIGDLDLLAAPPDPAGLRRGPPPPARLPIEAAAIGLVSMVDASGAADRVHGPRPPGRPAVSPLPPASRRQRRGRSLLARLRRGAGA
jgi:hypothetical protein